MENASKALLMAGAALLGMLLISLLFYAVGVIKNYKSSKEELITIENTAKFNQKFTVYDRDDVLGYELISLINQVIDYNERKSSDSLYKNDEQYPYIHLSITINEPEVFYRDETLGEQYRLFRKMTYAENELSAKNRNSPNSFKKSIEDKMTKALTDFHLQDDEIRANKVAKNIDSIFLTKDEIKDKSKLPSYGSEQAVYQDMANTYNLAVNPDTKITWQDAQKDFVIGNNNAERNNYYVYACMFYEYMQFKRGEFECTNLGYDNSTGRVKTISFIFKGTIH